MGPPDYACFWRISAVQHERLRRLGEVSPDDQAGWKTVREELAYPMNVTVATSGGVDSLHLQSEHGLRTRS